MSGLKTLAFTAPTLLLIRLATGGLGWQVSPSGQEWTVSVLPNSDPSRQYDSSWTQAVASAINSARDLVRPQHDMAGLVRPSRDDIQMEWLVRWAIAGSYGQTKKPFAPDEWNAAAPLRDWMAEALMLNPQAAVGTFYRAECTDGRARLDASICSSH
jgi:hypothetical protein